MGAIREPVPGLQEQAEAAEAAQRPAQRAAAIIVAIACGLMLVAGFVPHPWSAACFTAAALVVAVPVGLFTYRRTPSALQRFRDEARRTGPVHAGCADCGTPGGFGSPCEECGAELPTLEELGLDAANAPSTPLRERVPDEHRSLPYWLRQRRHTRAARAAGFALFAAATTCWYLFWLNVAPGTKWIPAALTTSPGLWFALALPVALPITLLTMRLPPIHELAHAFGTAFLVRCPTCTHQMVLGATCFRCLAIEPKSG